MGTAPACTLRRIRPMQGSMQSIPRIFGLVAGSIAMLFPFLGQADTVLSESASAEQIYQHFRQQHPSQVEACFPELDLVDGPGPLAWGAEGEGPGWLRAVIAVDASGSMAGQAGGEVKMQAATDAVTRFVQSLPGKAEIGLVVFGHKGSNDESGKAVSCAGVETLLPVGPDAAGAVTQALDAVQPTGWTPLATAIKAAGEALAPEAEEGEQVVFIVSDGEETCGGDPVAAARVLHDSGTRAIVNVIGFDLPAEDRAKLTEVAEVGGGVYLDAASGDEVMKALQRHSAWIQTRFDHNVEAVRAQTTNSTSSFVVKSNAQKCVADIQNSEYSLVSEWIHDLRQRGFSSEAFMGFREMVISDHGQNQEMLEAYRAKLDATSDEANRVIKETIVPPGTRAPETGD